MKIFYHSADIDGHCSGALLKNAFPESELKPINYGESFPWNEIKLDEEIYMVDFSLEPISDLWKLKSMCKRLIWIDHHKSAIEAYDIEVQKHNDRGIDGNRMVGKAGCELTWTLLHPTKTMPEFIELLGRYDVWDHGDIERWEYKILPFQMGMRLMETDPSKDIDLWPITFKMLEVGDDKRLVDINIGNGNSILQYQKQRNKALMASHAYEINWEGHKCLMLNSGRENSQTFESRYDPKKHDLMIAYSNIKGQHWTVSLYSETVDCSEIAKKYHGGGHKGAAGFTCDKLPDGWVN